MNTRSKSTGPRNAKGGGKKARQGKASQAHMAAPAASRGAPVMHRLASDNPFEVLSAQDGDAASEGTHTDDELGSQFLQPEDSASRIELGHTPATDIEDTPKGPDRYARAPPMGRHMADTTSASRPVMDEHTRISMVAQPTRLIGPQGGSAENKENRGPKSGQRPPRNLTLRGHDDTRRTTARGIGAQDPPEQLVLVPANERAQDTPRLDYVGPFRAPVFSTAPYIPAPPRRQDTPAPFGRDDEHPAQTGTQTTRLTASAVRQGRLPVGAPILLSRPVIPAKRAHPTDRSPNGRQIERDSNVPHKKPRLHAAGPLSDVPEFSLDSPMDVDEHERPDDQVRATALQVLAQAAAARSTSPTHSEGTATPRPTSRTTPPAPPPSPASSTSLTEVVYTRPDTPIPDFHSDPSLPEVLPASLEDYVASDTATIGTTTEPASALTPMPPSGFPDTQGGGPGWQLANQTKASLAGWLGIEGGKVLAVPFGQGANDHKISDKLFSTVAHIQQATARFLGVTTVHVAPPIAEKPVTDLNQAPYAFLVHGISEGRAAQLLQQKCLSTPNVTVLFFPFGFALPNLFVNFGHIVDCGCDMVRNMAIATMMRGPNFAAVVELLRETPGLPPTMDFFELARRLITTVRITRSERFGRGAVLTPVFNLFMSTSLMNADTWPRWHRLLNSFQWSDVFLAEVAVRNDVECDGCHGRDHYQHACPFLQVPGFFGTMPQNKKKTTNNAQTARASASKPGESSGQHQQHGARGTRPGRVFTRQPSTPRV